MVRVFRTAVGEGQYDGRSRCRRCKTRHLLSSKETIICRIGSLRASQYV